MTSPLLMALPQLMGARAPIQYTNYQPTLPGAALPKAPEMGHAAKMPSLPPISQPRQALQDPTSAFGGMGGGASGMQGLMNLTGFNPQYYANQLFGMGQSSVNPYNIAAPSFDMSSITLPTLPTF